MKTSGVDGVCPELTTTRARRGRGERPWAAAAVHLSPRSPLPIPTVKGRCPKGCAWWVPNGTAPPCWAPLSPVQLHTHVACGSLASLIPPFVSVV